MKKLLAIITICLIAFSTFGFCLSEPVEMTYKNGIYHIKIDGKRIGNGIKFIASEKLITNKEAHEKSGAKLTINTGFFDPKNQKTISYVMMDRQTVEDPLFNENLMMNPVLRQNIDKIINRPEFRVVECDDKFHYEIVPHKSPTEFGCNIVSSAQGGPTIWPNMNLEDEFFVVKKDGKVIRESASVLSRCARTIIALKGDDVHVLIITNENPKNIYEVREMCEKMGFDRAMAFDGGSSTSLNYKKSIDLVSTKDPAGRLLKSFMVVNW